MADKAYDLVTIDRKQFLAMVGELPFTDKQINLLMQKTPDKFIKRRPIPGGGEAEFVETHYVIGMLNLVTGYQWDFDILEEEEKYDQIIIRGKLTIRTQQDKSICKSQYGRSLIKFKKDTKTPLDYGNDKKAATSDAIKKCASLFGIAWDVYGKEDMREVQIVDQLVADQNEKATETEILNTPIEQVKEDVTKLLDTLTTADKLRKLKSVGKMSEKNLSENDYRRLWFDLGLDKKEAAAK